MKVRLALLMTAALAATTLSAVPAGAAGYCPSGQTYKRGFTYQGRLAAVLCVPQGYGAGTVSLQSQGIYRGRAKDMRLSVKTTQNGKSSTNSVRGIYSYYVTVARGAGLHDYHAIMYDGNGRQIINEYDIDYD